MAVPYSICNLHPSLKSVLQVNAAGIFLLTASSLPAYIQMKADEQLLKPESILHGTSSSHIKSGSGQPGFFLFMRKASFRRSASWQRFFPAVSRSELIKLLRNHIVDFSELHATTSANPDRSSLISAMLTAESSYIRR